MSLRDRNHALFGSRGGIEHSDALLLSHMIPVEVTEAATVPSSKTISARLDIWMKPCMSVSRSI